jgi:hypothetical protein
VFAASAAARGNSRFTGYRERRHKQQPSEQHSESDGDTAAHYKPECTAFHRAACLQSAPAMATMHA